MHFVKLNKDLSINSTKTLEIIKYLNYDSVYGKTIFIYFKASMFLSSYINFYITESLYSYVSYIYKINSFFDIDNWGK